MKASILGIGIVAAASGLAGAAEHPRLLVDKAKVTELRQRCQQEPYAAMARQIQGELKKVVGAEPKTPLYDDQLLDYAALYLLTGQKTFAAEAEKLALVCVNDKVTFAR